MKLLFFIIFYLFNNIFSFVKAKDFKIDGIQAIVNDHIILKSDVDQIILFLEKQNHGKVFEIPFKKNFLQEKILKQLISDTLILQQAKKMNIFITKKQISNMMNIIFLKKNIDANKFKNISIYDDLDKKNSIKSIQEFLKKKIVHDYEINEKINISEEKVNSLFKKIIKKNKDLKKINLSFIFIPFSKKNFNDDFYSKKILVENIVDTLKKGHDFKKTYAEYKTKSSTVLMKQNFWMRLLDMKRIFSNSFHVIKNGEIFQFFLKNKGFYILKINDIVNNQENIINEFYVQHCLIKPSLILSDLEAKNKIFNIYKNIQQKSYSFDNAVKRFSNDFYSANKTGNLGWISKDFINNKLYNELSSLHENNISRPIKSILGWHIFKLLKKREVDRFYSLKIKESKNILLNKEVQRQEHNWIKNLEDFSYIKIMQ